MSGMEEPSGPGTPLLRGWSHAVCALPAAGGAATLTALSHGEPLKQATLAVYGVALTALFAVSALYHCGRWSPRMRAVLRRIDHADIALLIAATYTPISAVLLDGVARIAVLCVAWGAALSVAAIAVLGLRVRRSVLVALYIGTGWVALLILPALYARVGAAGLAALCLGGVLYTLGAVAYGVQRPALWPRVFGYHEVFHLLVVAASAVFFAFIAGSVLPAAA
jgi:hemolysin III